MLPVHLFNVKHRRLDYHRERCQKTDLIRKSLVKSVCSFLSKEITSFSLTIHVSFEQRGGRNKTPIRHPPSYWGLACIMFYHNAPPDQWKQRGWGRHLDRIFFPEVQKGGGEIRSKFRKIFRRWFSFIVKNYEYTKRDLHEMALCVLNEDEWIIILYILYIHIYYKGILTLLLCSLSLSSPACSPKTHEPLPQESAFNGDSDFRKLSLLLTLWRFRNILRRVIRKIREM